MKLNKRKLLRYRITSWVVIVLISFQSGPMQLLAAVDDAAKSKPATSGFAGQPLPVDLERGALMLPLEDLSFKNEALPLSLMRIYRSNLNPQNKTLFGRRWHSVADMRLRFEGDKTVALTDEQGRGRTFKRTGDGPYISQRLDYEELHQVKDGDKVKYERLLKNGVKYVFEAAEGYQLTEISDRNGRYLKFEREERMITISDRYQRWIQIILKDGYAAAAIDSTGRSVRYTYDASGNLINVLTAAGGGYALTYDGESRLTGLDLGSGRWYGFTYKKGALFEQRSAVGAIRSYERSSSAEGLKVKVTDASRVVSDILFGSDGVISVTAPEKTMSRFKRDARQLPVRIEAAAGDLVEVAYDSRFNVERVIRNGSSVEYKYNDLDLPVEVKQQGGGTEKFEYDERGNPLTVYNAFGAATKLSWNSLGQLTGVNQPDGRCMTLKYDAAGLPSSINDNTSGTYRYGWYDNGLMRSYEIPEGVKTVLKYNAADNVRSVEDSEGRNVEMDFNAYGKVSAVRDAGGGVTTFGYDSMGMLTSVKDALGAVSSFGYGADGRAKSFTDAVGNTTEWEYDDAGRLVGESDAAGSKRRLRYDSSGRVAGYVNAREQPVSLGYDKYGRLSALNAASVKSLFEYDQNGRMVVMKNDVSEHRAVYDERGFIQCVQDGVLKKDVVYTYDSIGRRSSMVTPDGVVNYSYDDVGRVARIAKGSQWVEFVYDAYGRRSKLRYSNGTETSYGYDKQGRVTGISSRNADGEIIVSTAYAWNKADQVVRSVDDKGVDKKYEYDAAGQLVKVTQGVNVTVYHYDVAGNRIAVTRNGTRTDYKSGANNRVVEAGAESFEFDADGNMTGWNTSGGKNYTYAYDEFNRMTSVNGPNGAASYEYAPNGIMVSRIQDERKTRRLFDGGDVISELSDGKVDASYIHGPGVDEWLLIERGGKAFGCHADRMGSVIAYSDDAGKIKNRFAYDEFGRPESGIAHKGGVTSYTGREWDPQANMHYYRARFYAPETGRFNALDPLGLTQGPNQYTYVKNNPLSFKDPDGRIAILTLVAIGAVAGGLFDLGWQAWGNHDAGRGLLEGISGWSILGSAAIGALAPAIALIGAKTIAVLGGLQLTGAIGSAVTSFIAMGPQVVGTVVASFLSGGVGALEYIGTWMTGDKEFSIKEFVFSMGNRVGNLLFNVLTGGAAPSTIGRAIRDAIIGGPVGYIYSAISDYVKNNFITTGDGSRTGVQPGQPGGQPGGGQPGGGQPGGGQPGGGPPGGSGPGSGGGPSGGGGGNNKEYKRFNRFENWSTMNWNRGAECMAA